MKNLPKTFRVEDGRHCVKWAAEPNTQLYSDKTTSTLELRHVAHLSWGHWNQCALIQVTARRNSGTEPIPNNTTTLQLMNVVA
jgi:hypothetical protein